MSPVVVSTGPILQPMSGSLPAVAGRQVFRRAAQGAIKRWKQQGGSLSGEWSCGEKRTSAETLMAWGGG